MEIFCMQLKVETQFLLSLDAIDRIRSSSSAYSIVFTIQTALD